MHYRPMLLTKTDQLPYGEEWAYEPKWNGYRIIAESSLGRTVLFSRKGNNFTDRYPDVAQQLPAALDNRSAVVDGEIVGVDDEGNYSFSALHQRRAKAIYFIFDLLELEDQPLLNEPLQERRRLLEEAVAPQIGVRLVDMYLVADRDALIVNSVRLGLEGIVAKKLTSLYLPGRRSRNWLKWIVKEHSERWRKNQNQ